MTLSASFDLCSGYFFYAIRECGRSGNVVENTVVNIIWI